MLDYGEALRYQRDMVGLSQRELSVKINISQQNISRWERGEVLPSIEMCIKLADFYGISLDELVGRRQYGVTLATEVGNSKQK